MLCKEFINYQDRLFYVDRTIRESSIKMDKINELKELLGCDMVIKRGNNQDDQLLFLVEISQAEIVD